MNEFILIAGPQAAGKSTAIARLNEYYRSISALFGRKSTPPLFPLQESRQIVVHTHMLLGAIFMKLEHECQVVDCDWNRMDKLVKEKAGKAIYLDECNIFTLAHARAHGITGLKDKWSGYTRRLEALQAKVIFLDIPPEISWERRKAKYEERLIYFPRSQHKRILASYKHYLMKVHPLLHEVYDRLPLPKRMIDAKRPNKCVLKDISDALAELSTAFE